MKFHVSAAFLSLALAAQAQDREVYRREMRLEGARSVASADFDLRENHLYVVETVDLSAGCDPVMQLRRSTDPESSHADDPVVGEGDDGPGIGSAARIEWVCDRTMPYYAWVWAYSAERAGTLTITVNEGGEAQRLHEWEPTRLDGRNPYYSYDFELEAGQRYWIETYALSDGCDPVMELRRSTDPRRVLPEDPILALDDDGGSGRASRIDWVCDRTAAYYVKLFTHFENRGGEFRMRVMRIFAPTGANQEEPPNPPIHPGSAGLTYGSEARGELAPGLPQYSGGQYYVTYTFVGTTGDQVEILMESGEFDALLELAGSDGANITANDDAGDGTTNSRLVATLPADGEYQIMASSHRAEATGSFVVSLRLAEGRAEPISEEIAHAVEGPDGTGLMVPPGLGEPGERPRIEVAAEPAPPPEGCEPLGRAYRITPPASWEGREVPILVRLPVPEGTVTDPDHAVVMGLYDGASWEIRPAEVVGASAYGRFDHFSQVRLGIVPVFRQNIAQDMADARIRVGLWGIRMNGDRAEAILDISGARYARGRARFYQVDRIKVYATPPVRRETRSGVTFIAPPNVGAYPPFQVDGADVVLGTTPGPKTIPLPIDRARVMEVAGRNTVEEIHNWGFTFAPVYADGTEGPRMGPNPLLIPVGVAEAHLKLREQIVRRLQEGDPSRARRFDEATARSVYDIFLNPVLGQEAYGARQGAGWFLGDLWIRDAPFPHIGLTGTSEYYRVVSHEWGHYAVHQMVGDAAFQLLAGGSHTGWKELGSRNLAWAEDLATFLGQWGAGGRYPEGAGAMLGHWTDLSRNPEASGSDPLGSLWPNNREMDTTRVEGIPATILSKLSQELGFARVFGFIQDRLPLSIVDFFLMWNAGDSPDAGELALFQRTFLDERVAWQIQARVVSYADSAGGEAPIQGARVVVRTLSGEELPVLRDRLDAGYSRDPLTTGSDGRFRVVLPPGPVQFHVTQEGWEPGRFPYAVPAIERTPTNGQPAQAPPFHLRRSAPAGGFRLVDTRIAPLEVPAHRQPRAPTIRRGRFRTERRASRIAPRGQIGAGPPLTDGGSPFVGRRLPTCSRRDRSSRSRSRDRESGFKRGAGDPVPRRSTPTPATRAPWMRSAALRPPGEGSRNPMRTARPTRGSASTTRVVPWGSTRSSPSERPKTAPNGSGSSFFSGRMRFAAW